MFLLVLSAAGIVSLPWVHYEACVDFGLAPWRHWVHSTSLSWLYLARDCVPPP